MYKDWEMQHSYLYIKKKRRTEVNCECCVIIKLKHSKNLIIHNFKPYNVITNV